DKGATKTIKITRAHLEEDAGKSLHEDFHGRTGIDLNRAGTPLLEIVSEPDMRSSEEAVAYARAIHQLVVWLGISDGDMSQGSLRCDANVSLRKPGVTELGVRTETKNVNSFRFLKRAIDYEAARQAQVLEGGGKIVQETRLYDPAKDETRPMRSKETDLDYRYFPEPDLLPIALDQGYIEDIKQGMPELPWEKRQRYLSDYGLAVADADLLSSKMQLAEYFETALAACDDAALAANWIRGELLGHLNRADLELSESPVQPQALAKLIGRIKDKTISGKIAKQVFTALWDGSATDVDDYIASQGLQQVTDTDAIAPIVEQIIKDNPKEAADYQAGKTKLLGFFVGQAMKASGGKANPQQVSELVKQKLGS
ncbi:MAG: Asp-tRNA(Asn)/Glu-tRNA(Gln) amidotransferase subunit GatB, partial [Pseudomonadales bacterium]